MFTLHNPKLEEMIRNSKVLKQKLNEEEMNEFIKKALGMPKEGQDELMSELEQEDKKLSK